MDPSTVLLGFSYAFIQLAERQTSLPLAAEPENSTLVVPNPQLDTILNHFYPPLLFY
jgi:hypothetical protein